MALPPYHIQVATMPSELPGHVAKQLGQMWLKRYRPNPSLAAHKAFKQGRMVGCLTWALSDTGEVLAWALKAKYSGKTSYEVMVFVKARYRRQRLGDALLDTLRKWIQDVPVTYYPHSDEAGAFFGFREEKLAGIRRAI